MKNSYNKDKFLKILRFNNKLMNYHNKILTNKCQKIQNNYQINKSYNKNLTKNLLKKVIKKNNLNQGKIRKEPTHNFQFII